MDEATKIALQNVGVNVSEVTERFMGNEDLVIKFLRKFGDDQTMSSLRNEIAAQNYAEAFPLAHTLKGVCGNLAFTKLYNIFSKMCEDYRSEKFQNLTGLFVEAEAEYSKIIKVIKTL